MADSQTSSNKNKIYVEDKYSRAPRGRHSLVSERERDTVHSCTACARMYAHMHVQERREESLGRVMLTVG